MCVCLGHTGFLGLSSLAGLLFLVGIGRGIDSSKSEPDHEAPRPGWLLLARCQ